MCDFMLHSEITTIIILRFNTWFTKQKIYELQPTLETSAVQSLHLVQRWLFFAPFPAWSGTPLLNTPDT